MADPPGPVFDVLLQLEGPRALAADVRPVYEATIAEEAARQLDAFDEKWAGEYPSIAPPDTGMWPRPRRCLKVSENPIGREAPTNFLAPSHSAQRKCEPNQTAATARLTPNVETKPFLLQLV